MNKSIYQLLETFREDLKEAIKQDSERWLPDQEQDTYLAQNILDHLDYVLDFDPTGDTGAEDDYYLPCEWVSPDSGHQPVKRSRITANYTMPKGEG